jgi:hypothetical protein
MQLKYYATMMMEVQQQPSSTFFKRLVLREQNVTWATFWVGGIHGHRGDCTPFDLNLGTPQKTFFLNFDGKIILFTT